MSTVSPPVLPPPLPRSSTWIWLAFITTMVVYGSLIPLEYVPLSWEAATERFSRIPWLNLNADKRADWVANGLAYFPIGALAALSLLPQRCGVMVRLFVAAMAATAAGALAVGVEFIQVYFPKRTVSLNDIAAEAIGGGLGAIAGAFILPALWPRQGWWQRLHLNPRALGLTYAGALLYFGLFPFDLIIALDEWQAKITGSQVGWWLAGSQGIWRRAGSMALEVTASIPLALLLAGGSTGRPMHLVVRGAVWGAGIGFAMELMQLFMVSTISQGASVLTRSAGVALGALLMQGLQGLETERIRQLVRKLGFLGIPAHLAAVAWLSGGLSKPWQSVDAALLMLQEVRFLPFYYHYFVTEQQAMTSTMRVMALYAPVGIWVWANRSRRAPGQGGFTAALLAALLCAGGEAARLMAGLRPDPSNLIIAAATASILAAMLNWWSSSAESAIVSPPGQSTTAPSSPARGHTAAAPASMTLLAALGLLAFTLMMSGRWGWPVGSAMLATGAAALTAWRPNWALGLVAAISMIYDPRPWAAPSVVGEYDVIMALILAVAVWRQGRAIPASTAESESRPSDPHFRPLSLLILVGLLLASALTSVGRPVFEWGATGLPLATEPYGPLRALEAGKGVFWGCAFLGWSVWLANPVNRAALLKGLTIGIGIGSMGTACVMAWEWGALRGLAKPNEVLRLSGPLQDMAIGGGSNEAMLITGLAVAAACLASATGRAGRLAWLMVLAVGVLAALGSQSRAAHLALTLMAASGVCVGIVRSKGWNATAQNGSGRAVVGRWVMLIVLGAAASLGSWTAVRNLAGDAAALRMQRIEVETAERLQQPWSAFALHDATLTSAILGMGWANYPAHLYASSLPSERVMMSAVSTQHGSVGSIALYPGDSGSLNQPLRMGRAVPDQIMVEAEWEGLPASAGSHAAGEWKFLICRKWMLNSSGCVGHRFVATQGPAETARGINREAAQIPLDLRSLKQSRPMLDLPVMVALHASGQHPIRITRLVIRDMQSNEVLGGSTAAAPVPQSWMTASDTHIAWKIQSLWASVMWERGALGLICLALSVWAFTRATAASFWNTVFAALLFTGLGTLSLWDTPTHSGRFQAVWILLLICTVTQKSHFSRHA